MTSWGPRLAAIVALGAAACAGSAEPPSELAAPRPSRVVGEWALAPLALPRPAPRARPADFDPERENARCERCHATIAREWSASLHRSSWEDPIFLSAYVVEPQPFCRGCHAPEAEPTARPSLSAQHVGVGCVTCHVERGHVLAAPGAPPAKAHPVVEVEGLATADACTACHDFDFPTMPGVAMQSTGREHAGDGRAGEPCQGCHMPEVGEGSERHRRHDFRIAGDADALRRALRLTVERHGARALELVLERGEVGHALPTGDMFRRLELRAWVLDATGGVVEEVAPVVFARHFAVAMAGGFVSRRPTGDTRLFVRPGERERRVRIELPDAAAGRRVRYELVHRRMDGEHAALFDVPASVNDTVVFEGLVPAAPSSPGEPTLAEPVPSRPRGGP